MFVVAVTGGLGSGKTVAMRYFESRGAVTLDLDSIAHGVMYPGSEVLARVKEAFGPETVNDDDSVNRAELARIAFVDAGATATLNGIVHPVVLREVVEGINSLRLMERPPRMVMFEIPLLAEAPVFADIADTVLAISAPVDVRIARAVEKGMDEDEAWRRIARQATDQQRAQLAQYVIKNVGSLEEYHAKLKEFWDEVAPVGT